MKKAFEIKANLVANPFPENAKLGMARTLPLNNETDFLAIASLPVSSVPVWVSHAEHYALLSQILECVFEYMPDIETVLMRMQMPAGGRMPKLFLDERILMLQSVTSEEQILQADNESIFVIEDYIVRYPLEQGDNSLSLRYYSQKADDLMVIKPLMELLEKLYFSNIQIQAKES